MKLLRLLAANAEPAAAILDQKDLEESENNIAGSSEAEFEDMVPEKSKKSCSENFTG